MLFTVNDRFSPATVMASKVEVLGWAYTPSRTMTQFFRPLEAFSMRMVSVYLYRP